MIPKTLNALAVKLHGSRIGVINRIGVDRYLFSFEESYIDDTNRPTLSLSFKGQAGGLVIPTRPVTARLPVFFSNLLPEGHLRDYLAARAGVQRQREFFLLAVLGADLPGALNVATREQAEQSADNTEQENEQPIPDTALRFSLAGVQLKFLPSWKRPADSPLQPGHGRLMDCQAALQPLPAVPENECTMMALARAVRIEVPRTELIDIRDIRGVPADAGTMQGKALAVQRFDRGTMGRTIHTEDFAQVFSVLIGNADMHLKNWSLLYPDPAHTCVVACL